MLAAGAFSTIYVAYLWLPELDLFVSDVPWRWWDYLFLPQALAHAVAWDWLYPKSTPHPGFWRIMILGWVASLPVSLLYAQGLKALWRIRARSRTAPN